MDIAESSDVRLLYAAGFYDYPRSGALTWKGERFYLLRSRCKRVAYETDKNGVRSRVHTMKASTIRPVDPDIAETMLAEIEASIRGEDDD